MGRWVVLLAVGGVIAACSDKPRPGFLPDEMGDPGQGGSIGVSSGASGSGGAGASGSIAGAGGNGNKGGSAGSQGLSGNGGAVPMPDARAKDGGPPLPLTFDPNEVYLFGTLSEGSCSRDAVANIKAPDAYAAGFWCYHPAYTERIRGGKLLYLNGGAGALSQLLEFVPDLVSSADPSTISYPDDPASNDVVIPTPPCDPGGDGILNVRVGPTGRIVHQCGTPGSKWWYAEDGSKVYQGDLLALGNDDLIAVQVDSSLRGGVVKLSDGVVHPWPAGRIPQAIRSHPNGFHVVLLVQSTGLPQELWEMDANGTATKLGDYPKLPDGGLPNASAALTPDDTLFQMTLLNTFDAVARLTITGASEIIYTEKSDPHVKVNSGSLVTGP